MSTKDGVLPGLIGAMEDQAGSYLAPFTMQRNAEEIHLDGDRNSSCERVAQLMCLFRITAVSQIEEIDKTFRSVEQSWQEAGRSDKPRLVAQMEMALETQHIGQGRKNILDYYATLPPFDTYKSAALLTTEQQLRDTIHALQQIGADELIFFAWSTELDQIDRVAAVV